MLSKDKREERAVSRFLEYYNQVHETSYSGTNIDWLDRKPRIGQWQQGPIPDCLCKDPASGTAMVIEYTMLASKEGLKRTEGACKFLAEVRIRLERKLPGVFLLHDWGVDEIKYKSNTREEKISQLYQEILRVAPTLAEGEEAQLCQPFPVKLRKEEASKVRTNCALIYFLPSRAPSADCHRLKGILSEADRKFASYSHLLTVLLINIWETGLDYEAFKRELFQSVDMEAYKNIKQVYLSEGLPDPIIYHLWSRFERTS